MMSRDISSHAWRATTTRTHSPAYLHEEILASDGVPRDRDRLRAHGAAHGVDHLDEPYQLLSSVTAPTAPSAVRTHVVKDSLAERHYRAVSAGGSKPSPQPWTSTAHLLDGDKEGRWGCPRTVAASGLRPLRTSL